MYTNFKNDFYNNIEINTRIYLIIIKMLTIALINR